MGVATDQKFHQIQLKDSWDTDQKFDQIQLKDFLKVLSKTIGFFGSFYRPKVWSNSIERFFGTDQKFQIQLKDSLGVSTD